MLCGLGFVSAMIVGILDVQGMKQLGLSADIKIESRKLVSSHASIEMKKKSGKDFFICWITLHVKFLNS